MRKLRGSIESLPGDGWVRLAPGEFFERHVDRPLEPNLYALRHWMKKIRGGVLSASFGIENELILLALADEFGSNDHGREQEWREDHRLAPKIKRAKPVIMARKHKDADKIIQKLAEYRHLRNLLAHYPCWLEPVNDVELRQTIALKIFIADRSYYSFSHQSASGDFSFSRLLEAITAATSMGGLDLTAVEPGLPEGESI